VSADARDRIVMIFKKSLFFLFILFYYAKEKWFFFKMEILVLILK